LPLIYVGAALRWAWVRNWRWRALHLGVTAYVSAQSLLGMACPLTVWEDALRGNRTDTGCIERWIGRIMFYRLPGWVFTLAYCAFAVGVAVTWWTVRPTRRVAAALVSPRPGH
jgi:hypothetical protein